MDQRENRCSTGHFALRITGLCLCILLSACGGRPAALFAATSVVDLSGQQVIGATRHPIFIATTRAKAENPADMFSGERSPVLQFAKVEVSVPANHQPGSIEWPKRLPADPRKHFVGYDAGYLDNGSQLIANVEAALQQRAPEDRTILLFVHGYNTPFDAALYRLAQFVHDTGYRGVPVLFTWASRGGLRDYIYDRDSATAARDALEQSWYLLARTSARRGDIVAHSMGNWVTVEAMRQAQIRGRFNVNGRLGAVVLAAPDIDINVFETQMAAFPEGKRPFVVLISEDDKALAISRRIAGRIERVGALEDEERLAALGVTVVDLTEVRDGKGLHHTKFAASPDMVQVVGRFLNSGGTLVAQDTVGPKIPILGDLALLSNQIISGGRGRAISLGSVR